MALNDQLEDTERESIVGCCETMVILGHELTPSFDEQLNNLGKENKPNPTWGV